MNIPASSIQHTNFSINCNGRLVDLKPPKIMGILNLTPDSFRMVESFNEKSSTSSCRKIA